MTMTPMLHILLLLPCLGSSQQLSAPQQLTQLKQWHDDGLLSTAVWEEKQRATLLRLDTADPNQPVNARDFGAHGNCTRGTTPSTLTTVDCFGHDDQPALQAAMDAAQLQGRSLFIPAGIYSVFSPLVVHCTGARDLVRLSIAHHTVVYLLRASPPLSPPPTPPL